MLQTPGYLNKNEDRYRPEQLIERFLDRARALGWSPRTLESYRSHLDRFLDYLESETDIADVTAVTPEILHSYQMHLYAWVGEKGRGLSLATQAARLSAVRSFFRFLVRTDVLRYDPAAGIELPRRRKVLPRSMLSKKEMGGLLAAASERTPLGLRDRAMIEVLYSTGMRNAELRALGVGDLDLERGLVRISQGKNGRDRVVPLGNAACISVRQYLTAARPKLLPHMGNVEPTLFISKNGRPLLALGVIYPIRKYARQAGIDHVVTPHSLRHTFATHLLQGRADIRHIQAMLGHASVATTQLYTRVEVTDLKEVHRRCHPRERM